MEQDGRNAGLTGAECLIETLVASGVGPFFTNPGTSELHAVSAIDRSSTARGILCLFEGVATGAADGFGRISGRPAGVLLHLGPGLANGMANLHNARQAGTPMVVVVGEHGAIHLAYDSPLKSDLDGLPPFYSKHVVRLAVGDDIGSIARHAVHTTLTPPHGIATIIAGADAMWSETQSHPSAEAEGRRKGEPALDDVRGAMTALRSGLPWLSSPAVARIAGAKPADAIVRAIMLLCCLSIQRTAHAGWAANRAAIPYFPELAVPFLSKFSGWF